MIRSHKPWLPGNALFDGVIETAVRAQINKWSETGLCPAGDVYIECVDAEVVFDNTTDICAWHGAEFALAYSESFTKEIGTRLLGYDPGERKVRGNDNTLFENLGNEMIADLNSTLCEAFQLSKDIVKSEGPEAQQLIEHAALCFAVTFADVSKEVYLALEKSFVTTLRKQEVSEVPGPVIIQDLDLALAGQTISLSAKAGICNINLMEAEALSIGDVLILDRDLTDKLSLEINNQEVEGFSCRLSQSKNDKHLKVTHIGMDESRE